MHARYFVVNKAGVLQHVQIVPELTNEPDYEQVLDAVKQPNKVS